MATVGGLKANPETVTLVVVAKARGPAQNPAIRPTIFTICKKLRREFIISSTVSFEMMIPYILFPETSYWVIDQTGGRSSDSQEIGARLSSTPCFSVLKRCVRCELSC